MENVSETTRVNPKQILKDIESYHAFGTMNDYVTDRHNRATSDRHIGASLNRL